MELNNKKPETTLDRIYAWLQDDSTIYLTAKEEEQYRRYKFAFHQMLNSEQDHAIVDALKKQFGISERTAYRDIRETRKLFGDMNKTNKEADRNLYSQMLMEHRRTALLVGELSEANRAIAIASKIKGLDKSDPDLPNPETFQPHTYIIHVTVQGESFNKGKTLNLDTIAKLPPTEFEELLNQVDQTDIDDLHLIKLIQDARKSDEEA